MRVRLAEVLSVNRQFLSSFVPALQVGDPDDVVKLRASSRVSVVPDDAESEQVTVTFNTNMVLAVSDGISDLRSVVSLLNAAISAAGGSGASGLGSGNPTAGGVQAVTSIGSAAVDVIESIRTNKHSEDSFAVHVPVEESHADPPKKIRASLQIIGWTYTSDSDEDEVASARHWVTLAATDGNRIHTKNVGEQRQIPIDASRSEVIQPLTGQFLASATVQWNLNTDGAVTYDTVSLIKITEISLTIMYSV